VVCCLSPLSRGPDEVAWLGWAGLDMGWSLFGVEAGREEQGGGRFASGEGSGGFFLPLGLDGGMGLDCLGARKSVQAAAWAG
jgi:hypothetical protein